MTYLIEPERIKRAVGQFELNSLADARLQSLGKPVEMDRLEGRPLTMYSLYSQKWEEGDAFQPFGMNGKTKKLSKLFKDEKLTLIHKENTWVLWSENQIVWLV